MLLPGSEEKDDEVDTVVQPDIAVFCDKSKLAKRGARGAPDRIVDPKAEVTHAWRLGADGRYGVERIYEEREAVPSSMLEGFVVDLKELFAEQG